MFNVYFRDYLANRRRLVRTRGGAGAARGRDEQCLDRGQRTTFTKYYNGSWSEPGIGGRSSPLEVGNPTNWWSSVSYNDYLDQMVMVSSQWQAGGTGPDLYLATSTDGVNWSPAAAARARTPASRCIRRSSAPAPIRTRTGQSFYVYYTDGRRRWPWSDAQLARRLVTFDPSIPPVLPPPPGPDPGPARDLIRFRWIGRTISDFRDEFQGGGPAAGWTYAWNSNGRERRRFANFRRCCGANRPRPTTRPAARPLVPGSKTHNDDYLQLAAGWGHPGKPKYMPIAGYTIQEEDGAGIYRLIDSAIQKIDGTTSKNEDGLGVLVYLNNTLIGSSAASVATNGALANFDRELGNVNVGDTIWVMIDPLKSQSYDSFMNFDFSLQKLVPIEGGLAAMSLMAIGVPEPSSAAVLLTALVGTACVCVDAKRIDVEFAATIAMIVFAQDHGRLEVVMGAMRDVDDLEPAAPALVGRTSESMNTLQLCSIEFGFDVNTQPPGRHRLAGRKSSTNSGCCCSRLSSAGCAGSTRQVSSE